ncbi:TetR family transcriptional regulator [Chromobacterium amazonense]|uniref:TetR family transcriptional regulator n=1 Tax=Chromobacterium amazonense TaxID=1382803 RepID=A0A1S1WTG6_9NEIS|nr:TetR family transcriptional regulator [Chromobacterium amazonense]KIA80258.1 TetR family transcriptional regulator [Chromobacterium piscinae]MBM2885657.1 TetR family transcriptional regulator [Chromobacterium amazonense]MDE1713975.1 TetR family transcriptional regulator [Chromobacterium amazonense]MDQ4539531.1 TetR family transcriptional regulator [Chromobacterium amazonense]OHX10577.1 TetR family transcriptional regulator [Chromobacterium amazonense]
MARKTREEAEQTRQQLLDAAERLFSERGVSRTTLADIAAAAGLTRGAVYWHFQNKLDLYRAMLARVTPSFDDMREQLLLSAGSDPARALWEHSHRLLAVIEQNPQVRRILLILFLRSEHVGELEPIHEECVAHMHEARGLLRQVVQAAKAQGQTYGCVEPEEAATVLQSLHDGLMNRLVIEQPGPDATVAASRLLQYLYRGIFKPEVMEQLTT